MIKLLNACTSEIDDPEAAVREILSQIDLEGKLLKNSVGIIACYYEFIETGVISALCERLPFDVVGCTVTGSSINEHGSMEQLSLTVLTSDEVTFSTSFSAPVGKDNIAGPVTEAYRQARAQLAGDPALIFLLGPIMTDVSGEYIMKQLAEISGETPIFGTLSNDTSLIYENSRTFLNGESHQYKIALLLMHGDINPRFFVTAISEKNIQKQAAIVTESDGYLLKRVNNMPLLEYLATVGVHDNGLAAVTTLPFMVDYGDGTKPVAMSMYAITPEGAYCGGEMPVGASIVFAEVDYNSVIETAEKTIRQALEDAEKNGANGILIIPCFTRSLVLSPNSEDEITRTIELIGRKIPFMLIYSGGEICPVYNEQHQTVNRFHNLTYTLVVF
ncbi:MAG: FIST C-terminal domain-containing protein [Desulfarculales bacterium]|jgi:hypothetical protein|nr:FIST C-terminal domain-containing protein [Desulfarculales bacterium]